MMNILNLLWIIPVCLIVGGVVGYGICAYRVVKEQAKEYDRIHKGEC